MGKAQMKYAVNTINFGDDCGDVRTLAMLAREAETAGWDGFFIWDHIAFPWPVAMADATVALAAIATSTERIRFGAMVTPLPRRRPWKFARETASLDRLSGGRLIVGVGIGNSEQEFDHLGEVADLRTRGAMLDEALEVVTGLWRGEPFSCQGEHYTVKEAHFLPTPIQQPRIPIWVAGLWPGGAPFRRAAKWDGVMPVRRDLDPSKTLSLDDEKAIVDYIGERRTSSGPFDVSHYGPTPGDAPAQAADIVGAYAAIGVTWWHEDISPLRFAQSPLPALDAMRERIRQGPPRI
jgi:alkanesulfonate monooxygenase SsuD/methylene tetrahydromethanopterin reductase-like flavin-dependent oxidoreductase (luciferase family)